MFLIPFYLFSQDTLIYKSGKKVVCKIVKIEKDIVYYQKAKSGKDKQVALAKLERYTTKPTKITEQKDDKTQEYVVNEDLKLPYIDNKVVFSNTFKVKSANAQDQLALFKKYIAESKEGLSKSFKSENKETNTVNSKMVLQSSYETFFGTEKSQVSFTATFIAGQGEVTVQFSNIYISSAKGSTTIEVWDSHSGEFFKSQLDHLVVQYANLHKEIEEKIKAY